MTTREWRDLKFDNIYANYEWSPAGVLQPDDNLVMATGSAFMGSGDLNGDTLVLVGATALTQPTIVVEGPASLNVLILAGIPDDQTGLANDAYGTVRIVGSPHVNVSTDIDTFGPYQITGLVQIDPYSTWHGSLSAQYGTVTVNAPQTSLFSNENSAIGGFRFGAAVIDAQVVGVGTFDVGTAGSLTFMAGVGSGQTIDAQGFLTIDDVKHFFGSIDLMPTFNSLITLTGFEADAYSFASDRLSLYSDGKDVKDINLHIEAGFGPSVTQSGGNLLISYTDPGPENVVIPIHPANA